MRFSTGDRAEGLAVVEEVYAVHGVDTAAPQDFSMALSAATMGSVSLERGRWQGCLVACKAQHAEVLRVGQVLDGALEATSDGDAFAHRGPFLFPQRPYTSRWENVELFTVSLDAKATQDYARALQGRDTLSLRFTSTRPVNAAMGRYWQGLITHVSRNLLPHEELLRNPLLAAETTRSLLTAVLHTFPNTFLDLPRPSDGAQAVPAGVRRAKAFIDAHLDEPIDLAQIAAAARMSPRGLQAAFRREMDTTPLGYLRTARMGAAHAELVAADPTTGITVTDVAARWGFTHPGRFAAAYRAAYGHNPAHTLHHP